MNKISHCTEKELRIIELAKVLFQLDISSTTEDKNVNNSSTSQKCVENLIRNSRLSDKFSRLLRRPNILRLPNFKMSELSFTTLNSSYR